MNSLTNGGTFNGIDCQYEALRLILDEHISQNAKAAILAQEKNI